MNRDLLIAKADTVHRCIGRISQTLQGDFERLEDMDCQDITVLNLQRAIQGVVDMGAYLQAFLEAPVPRTVKEHFRILADQGVISKELEKKMVSMAGFRNIAVHSYQELNLHILKAVCREHLIDLEEFCRVALAFGISRDTTLPLDS